VGLKDSTLAKELSSYGVASDSKNNFYGMNLNGTYIIKVDAKTGAKVVLGDVCVGCKVCTIACPFGTVNYVQSTGKVQKCDLCGGAPKCSEACPTGAITYIDSDWTGLERMAEWAKKLAGDQPASEQPNISQPA